MPEAPAALVQMLNAPFTSTPTRKRRRRSTRPRDSQRQRLYDAERRVNHGQDYKSIHDCQARVDKITHSRWWKSRYGVPYNVDVRPGRGHRHATANAMLRVIQLPLWARYDLVICHELAHLVVSSKHPAHGPKFAREMIAIVDRWMGKEAGKELRAAFKAGRVKYIVRTK